MDLKTYLEKKRNIQDDTARRVSCLKCLRPAECCFCGDVTPFHTQTKFVLLMHPKEAKKQKVGTGRMTHHLLSHSEIIVGENFDDNKRLQDILSSKDREYLLLYPGKESLCLSSQANQRSFDKTKKYVVFILDGTWPCAKSMMRESRCLHHLKRISFSRSIQSKFEIKHQPADYCLSTIESVYCLLEDLDKIGLEQVGELKEQLIDQLDRLVGFQKMCAEDPTRNHYVRSSKPFKTVEERVRSDKKRKIFYVKENN